MMMVRVLLEEIKHYGRCLDASLSNEKFSMLNQNRDKIRKQFRSNIRVEKAYKATI